MISHHLHYILRVH